MTRLSACTAALALAAGLALAAPVRAETCDPKPAFDAFVNAIRTNDSAGLAAMTMDSPDVVFLGTDGKERWVGHDAMLAAFDAQLAAFKTTGIDVSDAVVQTSPSCDAAIFSSIWNWHISESGKDMALDGLRVTGAFIRDGGNWRLAQFHFSVPVGGQAVTY